MAESNFDADAELYEYDAPSEVVDLKELQDVEGDDKWFGEFSFSLQHISWWLLAIVVLLVLVFGPVGPNKARHSRCVWLTTYFSSPAFVLVVQFET